MSTNTIMSYDALKFYISNPRKWDNPLCFDRTTLEVQFKNTSHILRMGLSDDGKRVSLQYVIQYLLREDLWIDLTWIPIAVALPLEDVDYWFSESLYDKIVGNIADANLFYRCVNTMSPLDEREFKLALTCYKRFVIVGKEGNYFSVIDVADFVIESYTAEQLLEIAKKGIKIAGLVMCKDRYSGDFNPTYSVVKPLVFCVLN